MIVGSTDESSDEVCAIADESLKMNEAVVISATRNAFFFINTSPTIPLADTLLSSVDHIVSAISLEVQVFSVSPKGNSTVGKARDQRRKGLKILAFLHFSTKFGPKPTAMSVSHEPMTQSARISASNAPRSKAYPIRGAGEPSNADLPGPGRRSGFRSFSGMKPARPGLLPTSAVERCKPSSRYTGIDISAVRSLLPALSTAWRQAGGALLPGRAGDLPPRLPGRHLTA